MEFTYITKRGERLQLIGNEYFFLTNVDGQTEANANLTSVVTGGVDGDTVTSEQVQPRSLVLTLRIKSGVNVEKAKREILKKFKIKQDGTILWTQNSRSVNIKGIVESIEMPRWTNAVVMQITLHCEQPFWEDIENVIQEINEFINLHYFTDDPLDMLYFPEEGIPFGMFDTLRTKTFYNAGDVSVGIIIEINALGTVTNPKIYDTDGNFFGVGYGTGNKKVVLSSGDRVVISTVKGNKTVTLNGVSIYDKIAPHSQWLQLETESNNFRIESDDKDEHGNPIIDNMVFNITYKQRYL